MLVVVGCSIPFGLSLLDPKRDDELEKAGKVLASFPDFGFSVAVLVIQVSLVFSCLVFTTFFSIFHFPFSISHFPFSIFCFELNPQVLKVQKAVSYGASLFSAEHSNGLIFVLLIGTDLGGFT